MRKVIVCGGRDFNDREAIYAALDAEHRREPISDVVEGGQTGADRTAGQWARDRGVTCHQILAAWGRWGNRAGPIRNERMLRFYGPIAAVIAFPGGRGTADMVRKARAQGIPIIEPLG